MPFNSQPFSAGLILQVLMKPRNQIYSLKYLLTTSSFFVINSSIISITLFLAPIAKGEKMDNSYNPTIY